MVVGPFEEFVGKARRGLETLAEALALLRQASEKAEQAHAELTSATEGTGNDRVNGSLGRLDRATRALSEALTHGLAGRDEFTRYLTLIGAGAAFTGGADTPFDGKRPAAVTSGSEPSRLKDFTPDKPHRQALEEIKRVGWPRTGDGRVQARGYLYDSEGRKLFPSPLRASGHGPGSDTRDLKEPYRSDARYKTRYHVEGHTAAHMRRNGITEAVLYISIPPCGRRDKDPYRCDANMAKLLPEGSRLVVWVVRERGMPERIVYRGTGEALT